MTSQPAPNELRDRFFKVLLETVLTMKTGPDPEVTLEALIDAVGSLQEHLERELEEIRLEQAD
jgi:hypothetical protein